MRNKIITAALLLTVFAAPLYSQGRHEVRRVASDSLVNYIRHHIKPEVYFVKDAEDVASFSVSGTSDAFLQDALTQLRDKGYTVSSYDGAYFISRSPDLVLDLPTGYFAKEESHSGNDELLRLIGEQNTIASFQNKVYEIGDYKEGRSGKAYVRGYVRDVSSGEPLVGVSVYDEKTGAYSITDAYGFYRVSLPIGENVLGFSGYSLEDMHLNVIVNDDGGLDVVMKEKVTSLTGAVVSAESMSGHRDARMGVERVRMNVIKKVPTSFGEADVLQVVLTLPGVKSVGEASSGFNVRGGAADQNLILFNEGTIYNPSHMFGILSAFNPDVINDVELYKSSIPAEFGGRISSVLDIRGKEGNSKKVTGSLGIGMLTSSFSLEGPIVKDRTTFVLGGRTTYSNWLLDLLPESSGYSGGRATFSDANIGISHKINSRNSIHAYGYWSADRFSFSADTTFRYRNVNASLKWRSQLGERHSLTVTTGFDSYDNAIDDYLNSFGAYTLATRVSQGFAKIHFSSQLGSFHKLNYGVQGIYYDLNPGSLSPLGEHSMVVERHLDVENAIEAAAYLSDVWTPGEHFSLEYGVRYSHFRALEPKQDYGAPEYRISAKYSFLDNLSIKAGFNSMNQYIHMISNTSSISPTDTWKLCDENIRPQEGWQGAGGLYWTFANNKVDFSVEGYYKEMSHYLDYKSGAVLSMNDHLADDLVETYGKAYGVEVMLKKNLGKLNGWVSYTYARSFLREMYDRGMETINRGEWYSAPHDKPHDVNFVGNFQFTHRYSLSLNVDYATGRPVTVPVGKYYYAGGFRLSYSDRNSYRIPDYFRMDVALNIEPGHNVKKLTHMSFTMGVYNVTGRKNAYSVFYKSTSGVNVSGYMISVFATQVPYVNLSLKF